jgi:hypothetical protein
VRCVPALLLLLALVPSADAATPRPRTMVEDHRHYTRGHDWHVQLDVDRSAKRLASVVAYSQECGETGFTQKVRLEPDGSFAIERPLADGAGSFSVAGRFTSPDRASGTWSVVTPDCTAGGPFRAQDASGHFLLGNPYEYAPKRIRGATHRAVVLRRFLNQVHLAGRYFTPRYARRHGYEMSTAAGCPGLNHARKGGTAMWGPLLDPMQPQSLVYWCDAQRRWRLAGMMFRAAGRSRPPTFGNLVQWHKHGATRTATWMTHVWMVRDPVSAFASCAPFRTFAEAGMFSYHRYIAVPGDAPCSDTPGL